MASQDPNPQQQQQIEWETPSRPPRRGLMSHLLPTPPPKTFGKSPPSHTADDDEALAKEAAVGLGPSATHTTTFDTIVAEPTRGPRNTTSSPLRRRLDALLPPHRTYFGRSRRFVLVAAAIALLALLVLIIGLAVGLRARDSSSKPADLPLPSSGGTFTGDLTFYNPALGACGWTNTDHDVVVAVSHSVFDAVGGANPNANPLCGRKVRIVRDFVESAGAGNRSVDATVVDRCVGCLPADLDVTPAVFDQLAPESAGRVKASWAWLD